MFARARSEAPSDNAARQPEPPAAADGDDEEEEVSSALRDGPTSLSSRREALNHLNKAVLAVRSGNRRQAIAELEAAMQLDPHNPVLVASRNRLLNKWWRPRE